MDDSHLVVVLNQERMIEAEIKTSLAIVSSLGLQPMKDGNQFYFLWGENLQEGIAGFGDTVEDAVRSFNKSFRWQKAGVPHLNSKGTPCKK